MAPAPAPFAKAITGFEATKKENEYNIRMTDDELAELRRATAGHPDDLIIQLGGYVGPRVFQEAGLA